MSEHSSIALPRIAALLAVVLVVLWLTNHWASSKYTSEPFRIGLLSKTNARIGNQALRAGHLNNKRYQIARFDDKNEAIRAYRNGMIDAISLDVSSFLQLIQHDPSHKVILVLSHKPVEYQKFESEAARDNLIAPAAAEVLVVPSSTASQRRLTLRRLAQGWFSTTKELDKASKNISSMSFASLLVPSSHAAEISSSSSSTTAARPIAIAGRKVNLLLLQGQHPALERQLAITASKLLSAKKLTRAVPPFGLTAQTALGGKA